MSAVSQPESPDVLRLPADWEVPDVQMQVNAKRVWIPVSETTAMVLAAVLIHKCVSADTWIAERAIADASAPPLSAEKGGDAP